MAEKNTIWIELNKPESLVHAQLQCELANNLLRRLINGQEQSHWFSAAEFDGRVRYFYGNDGGDAELLDNGHWFNLDYLGRPGQ